MIKAAAATLAAIESEVEPVNANARTWPGLATAAAESRPTTGASHRLVCCQVHLNQARLNQAPRRLSAHSSLSTSTDLRCSGGRRRRS